MKLTLLYAVHSIERDQKYCSLMKAYRIEKILSQNGKLNLEALPFKEGEAVEIIILPVDSRICVTNKYPLIRGTVIKYERPTELLVISAYKIRE
ncbi:MAG TPA: hypothetical protein VJL89_03575 [Thermodesulfovibrionia bacterium]|nr:hypothetical protein [Thermodesulfovibrionia bacterium]